MALHMKLDKKMIEQLTALPDEKLGQMLQLLAAGSGISLGKGEISAAGIRKIRAILEEVTDGDIERVVEFIDIYKNTK